MIKANPIYEISWVERKLVERVGLEPTHEEKKRGIGLDNENPPLCRPSSRSGKLRSP